MILKFPKSDSIIDIIAITPLHSDQCRGLLIENHLSTNSTFPITFGTEITVQCAHEYELRGSEVITCEEGRVYSHRLGRPYCFKQTGINLIWGSYNLYLLSENIKNTYDN